MKSLSARAAIISVIFLIFFVSALCVLPLHRKITAVTDANREHYTLLLAELTGIQLRYTSFSPSLFFAARVKNLELLDAENGKQIAVIKSAVLSYDAKKILKGDFQNAFKKLSVRGVRFDAETLIQSAALQKLITLIETYNADSDTSREQTLRFPFDIDAKSISVYTGNLISADCVFFAQSALLTRGKNGYVKTSVRGNASIIPDKTIIQKIPAQLRNEIGKCAFEFALSGLISPSLMNSTLAVSFPSIRLSNTEFRKLDFFAEYLGDSIRVTQISGFHASARQNARTNAASSVPLDFVCDISLPVETVRVRMRADSFNPLAAVRVQSPAIAALNGTRISGDYALTWKKSINSIDYEARGKIGFPSHKTLGSLTSDFFITGNTTEARARRLNLFSEKLEASFEGGFKFKSLQPSGQAEIARFELPNGNEMSAEIYFDPLDEGFLCFVPQLFFGESSFTALQLTVIPNAADFDFSFELSDYSHYEFDEPGMLRMEGSLLMQSPAFAQTYVAIENFFLDSILNAASFFLSEQTASRLASAAGFTEPYILTNEMFVSTDFSSLTYNVPYSIIANTRRDRNFMLFSVDGNSTSFRVTRFDLAQPGLSVQAQFAVDASEDYKDFFFTADAVANAIPYNFSGSIVPGVMANITGNYGFIATVYDNAGNGFTGDVTLGDFPVAAAQFIFSLSADADFSWSPAAGLAASVTSLEVTEVNGAIPVNPRLMLSGALNDYGFRIETLSYSDTVSQMNGQGGITWSSAGSVLDSIVFTFSAENPLGPERISAQINVSNPERIPFSSNALREHYYFSAIAEVHEFLMARFFQNQSQNDIISAQFSALGTIADPFVMFTVLQSSVTLIAGRLTASGSAALDDGNLNITGVNAKWGLHELHEASAELSLKDYLGQAKGEYFFNFGQKSITAPLSASFISDGPSVNPETGKTGFPRSFVFTLSSSGCVSPVFQSPKPFSIRAIRLPGRIDIATTGTDNIAFWMLDSGELDFKLGGALPINMHAEGTVKRNSNRQNQGTQTQDAIDIAVNNIKINTASFSPFLDFGVFAAHKGIIEGNLHIGGLLSDPDFDGALALSDIEISSPQFAPAHFTSDFAAANIEENILVINDVPLQSGKSGKVTFGLEMDIDRWTVELLRLRFVTPGSATLPIDTKFDRIYARGDVSGNMTVEVHRDTVLISGAVRGESGTLEVVLTDLGTETQSAETALYNTAVDVNVNLQIFVGQRMQLLLNTTQGDTPIGFRGLVAQGTEIRLLIDTFTDSFAIQGDVALRGGEIVYFNRNFYLREGRIVFNETMGIFDPRITVRAETRDRDSEGAQVRIIMSASNQLLSQFNPVFTSSPAKSEAELMQILGQIVTGDSESLGDLAFAVLDYGVQTVVLRKIETGLRELLNFDIFSMRTMMVQNALRAQLDPQRKGNPIAAGSVFDNSTVYAGKYFGSSIYADALLHMSYDENEILSGRSETGIVFQPEFGLEMMSPYVTIRWSISPELGKTDFLWVDATSITLSWKFNF